MEDIIVNAYSSFEDFHNKYYWSCQPSYMPNYAYYDILRYDGLYYEDDNGIYIDGDNKKNKRNNGFARATKANYKGDDKDDNTLDWEYAKSGTSGYDNALNIFSIIIYKDTDMYYTGEYRSRKLENWDTPTMESISREECNFERSTKHRVRCARKHNKTNTSTTE